MLGDFYGLIDEGLGNKLGAVLFQLPPNFSYQPSHLRRMVEGLNPSFKNVVEFRHESWWNQHVFDELGKHHIAFSGISHPGFPANLVVNSRHLYYRFHGYPDLYRSAYAHKELYELATTLIKTDHVDEAYVYFNNDVLVHAPKNAQELIRLTSVETPLN